MSVSCAIIPNTAGGAAMSLCLSADRGQVRLRVAPNHLPVDLGRVVASLLRAPFWAEVVHA
jgi:hypothetical protein